MPRVSRYGPNVHPPAIDLELATYLEEHHRGHWVAIDDGRLIAWGESITDVHRRAREQGVASPLLHRVSAYPGRPALHWHPR